MENFVHASVSHAALAEFGRNARAVGVQLHALEIFEKNECMVRWAVAPYSCGDKREMYSLSKSFTSTAAGVAFGMGKLHPDDRVLDWFPEYASLCSGDARWSRLRVGHVLSMNTGHAACVMPQAAFSQDGVLSEELGCLSRKISRCAKLPLSAGKTRICLDVLAEQGLLQLEQRPKSLCIRLCANGRKVDLEKSPILIHLKKQKAGN